jgi:hypothetical protein
MIKSLKSIKSACGATLIDQLKSLRWHTHQRNCPSINGALELMSRDHLLYAVNISQRYRYVYMDNPKTGCSSLKSALVQLEIKNILTQMDHYDWRVFHDRSKSPLTRLDDLRHPTSLSTLQREGYRFITMVRNPYTRLLSCYRDKILGNSFQKHQVLAVLGNPDGPIETDISFSEFVHAVSQQADKDMNPHWRLQSSQILHGILDYEFIGRFEDYERDFIEIFRAIGVVDEDIPEHRHLNRTKTGPSEHCEAFYTPELQEAVYQRYRPDFDNFGYSFELPL